MNNDIISGAIVSLVFTAALFFLRFWTMARDRLLLMFAMAFTLLGVERLILIFLEIPSESKSLVYLIRLVAYSLIIIAIVDKNRSRPAA